MKTVEIGTKPLSKLNQEHLRQIVMIIGACPSLEFWSEPIVLDFVGKTFSDSVVIDYASVRMSDKKPGAICTLFFNFKDLTLHVVKNYERLLDRAPHHTRDVNFKVIKYLISQGFDVPIY